MPADLLKDNNDKHVFKKTEMPQTEGGQNITSDMNFVPQRRISYINTVSQETTDETNLSGATTKSDLVSKIFSIVYGQPEQKILS